MDKPVDMQERIAWLRLSRTEGIGPVTFHRLVERFGSVDAALEAVPELSRRSGRKTPLTVYPRASAEAEIARLGRLGGQILCARDEAYPLALSALADAPPVISVLGDVGLFRRPCCAIVGARNASLNGKKFAASLARDLGQAGYVIVSGLARGIDTSAHEGALDSGTITVLAGGVDVVYPEENQKLYEKIAKGGLVVAESPLGQQPFAQSFPRRNRIVSGLSLGVVVVEATPRSGSLITARMAAEQGRDVFAVPGFPADPRAQGPNALIREGAVLVRDSRDVVEHLSGFSAARVLPSGFSEPVYDGSGIFEECSGLFADQPCAGDPVDFPENTQDMILRILSATPVEVDEIVRACQLSIPAVCAALLDLEMAAKICRHAGNRVSLAQ